MMKAKTKRLKHCKRCGNIYLASSKYGRICDACIIHPPRNITKTGDTDLRCGDYNKWRRNLKEQ